MIALLLLLLLCTPALAAPPTYPNEFCSATGADSPATLSTGYFYFHLFQGKYYFEVAPDGCAIAPVGIVGLSATYSAGGNYLMPYDKVLTLPNGSTTATNVTQTATDAHEGIGDTAVGGTNGDSLIFGSSGFPPLFVQVQPGTFATPGNTAYVKVQYLTSGGWVNVDSAGANLGKPAVVNGASSATACSAGYYCYDVRGANESGVGSNGFYGFNGSLSTKANIIQLFSTATSCPTTGSNCWTPAGFTKQNIAAVLGLTGVGDTTTRWYIRFVVSGANFTTIPANMLAQIVEVTNPELVLLRRYGGNDSSALANMLSWNWGEGHATGQIKMANDLMPSLINAGINATAEGHAPIVAALSGNGGITVNSNALVPAEINSTLSEWAAGRPGPSPAITSYYLKDPSTNNAPYVNGGACGGGQIAVDVFDPNAQTVYNAAAAYQLSVGTYNGTGYWIADYHNGAKVFGIETEEGDFTPWGDSLYHVYFGTTPLTTNPVGGMNTSNGYGATVQAGHYQLYTKSLGWRDFELTNLECTGNGTTHSGTGAACCTNAGTGTCSADSAADGSASYNGRTYIGGTQASDGLSLLNTRFGLTGTTACDGTVSKACNSAYTTWNSSTNTMADISAGTYTGYGTGTGVLDENGKRVQNQCAYKWYSGASNFQNWGGTTAANIYADAQAFMTKFAAQYESEIYDAYNTALGSTTPNGNRPPMFCTDGDPPDATLKGFAPYCDAILTFGGVALYPGSTIDGNVSYDPSVIQSNLNSWVADAYTSAGHSVPFADLNFVAGDGDSPDALDLNGQTGAGNANCKLSSVTYNSGPNTTSLVATSCPYMLGTSLGLYSPDNSGCTANSAGVMNPIPTPSVNSVDYTYGSTTFTVAGNWTCLSVGNHLQGARGGSAAPGFAGQASKQVGVFDFNSWALESANHWTYKTNELNVTDAAGHHPFTGQQFYWDGLFPDGMTTAGNSWGVLDYLGNLLDGVEDTAAGGCSSIVGTCSNANCVDLAFKNSGVLCDPQGYPTGGDGPLLALYPGNSGSMGNRIGPPCTLAGQTGCGIDLNAISYSLGPSGLPAGTGGANYGLGAW